MGRMTRSARPQGVAARSPHFDPQVHPTSPRGHEGTSLWIGLIVLTLVRLVLAVIPSMWLWGANIFRFLEPTTTLGLSLLALLALSPRIARSTTHWLTWNAARGLVGPWLLPVLAAATTGGALLLLPDRTWFIGDFMLRQRASTETIFQPFFHQSMPLDVLLHHTLPTLLQTTLGTSPNTFARLLGAAEGASLAALALVFFRSQQRPLHAVLAGAAIVTVGGHLVAFVGYGRSTAEQCLLTAAFAFAATRALRDVRWAPAAALAAALAIATHRAMLVLYLPLAVTLVWSWCNARRSRERLTLGLSAAVALGALALLGPAMARTFGGFDIARHLLSPDVQAAGGVLRAAVDPRRLLDLLNAILLMSPLVLVVLPLAALTFTRKAFSIELTVLLTLLGAFLPELIVSHPQQGLFRDWEVFAPAGIALNIVLAWYVAGLLEARAEFSWLMVPVVAGVAIPTLGLLIHSTDLPRGLARVAAYATERPTPSATDQASSWEYIGNRCSQLGWWRESAHAFQQATALAPHRRMLISLALSEFHAGELRNSLEGFRRLVAREPRDAIGWLGITAVAAQLGDTSAARDGVRHVERLLTSPSGMREIRQMLAVEPLVRAGYEQAVRTP